MFLGSLDDSGLSGTNGTWAYGCRSSGAQCPLDQVIGLRCLGEVWRGTGVPSWTRLLRYFTRAQPMAEASDEDSYVRFYARCNWLVVVVVVMVDSGIPGWAHVGGSFSPQPEAFLAALF